jgi:serine/threonine protein kinase
MTLERGYLLNQRYRIVEILGQGGMASVYRAIDENLGVEVALKENLFTTDEYARQFRREAVILANLRHPNLPRVTDHFVIEQQGQYLVMDYIEGEDLRQRMERIGSLPEQEVIIIGVALCDALTYLHSRSPQVLHRDIKPGNVKITPSGQIFLVDFGLAKMVVGRQATTTGARAMTPGYSPPEQYGTARTDHRSDIYSLGATMYSALTNAIPEDGLARAMEQVELTPLVKRNGQISKRMANVIEKALEVRPDGRYQSGEEFKNALLNSRTSNKRKLPLDLMLEPPPVDEEAEEIPEDESENGIGNGLGQSISEPISMHSVPLQDGLDEPLVVTPPPPIKQPVKRGNFLRNMTLWFILILIVAVSVVVVLNPNLPGQMGEYLSSTMIPSLSEYLFPGSGGTPVGGFEPTNTNQVVVVAQETSTPEPSLTSEAADMSASKTSSLTVTLTPTVTNTATPSLSPTTTISPKPTTSPTMTGGGIGKIAFVSNRNDNIPNIWLINVDGKGLTPLTALEAGACQPSWSPDGKRLVFVSPCSVGKKFLPDSGLYIIDQLGKDLTPIQNQAYNPAWSPDGTRIAFVSVREGGTPQIFIYNLEDESVLYLKDIDGGLRPNTNPTWSPDSQKIAFVGSDNQIRAMFADGTGRILLVKNAFDFNNAEPVWSPNGETIIFSQQPKDLGSIWLASASVSSESNLASKIQNSDLFRQVSFSPDGKWIAVTGNPDGYHELYIMTTDGVNLTQLTGTEDDFYEFDPAWSPVLLP